MTFFTLQCGHIIIHSLLSTSYQKCILKAYQKPSKHLSSQGMFHTQTVTQDEDSASSHPSLQFGYSFANTQFAL